MSPARTTHMNTNMKLACKHLWATILAETLVLCGILIFMHREVRSPYLNPRLCWWKTSPRFFS